MKRYSENMQRIYRRTLMPKCDFILRHGNSPVNLLHIFRTPLLRTTLDGCYCNLNVFFVNSDIFIQIQIRIFLSNKMLCICQVNNHTHYL